MSDEEKGTKKFVVRDRRRFDSDGNERGDGEASSGTRSAGGSAASASAQKPADASRGSRSAADEFVRTDFRSGAEYKTEHHERRQAAGELSRQRGSGESSEDLGEYEMDASGNQSEINFSSFVISLATQGLMQLGEIKPPDGMQIPVDREGARQTIEILSMLDLKTKGNLSPDEAKLMEEVLHNLRLSFVRQAQKSGAPLK